MNVIVARDFNARHGFWSSPTNDVKGNVLVDMAHALDLIVCNYGDTPTQERGGSQSYIDVTLVSARLRSRLTSWEVLQEETLSDHNYIAFTVSAATVTPQRMTGWFTRHIHRARFLESLAGWEPVVSASAEESEQDLTGVLTF